MGFNFKKYIKPIATVLNPVAAAQGLVGDIKDEFGRFGETVQGGIDDIRGKTAAEEAKRAAATAASAELDKLDYLKEFYALPRQFRDVALTRLGNLYGGTPEQQQMEQERLLSTARQSPLYESILGTREMGEEAILRTASATGGLRSGNTIRDITGFGANLEQDALMQAYNQQLGGLQSLAGLQAGGQQIAQGISDIGQVRAQGILGAAQARQQGIQNLINIGLGAGKIIPGFL